MIIAVTRINAPAPALDAYTASDTFRAHHGGSAQGGGIEYYQGELVI